MVYTPGIRKLGGALVGLTNDSGVFQGHFMAGSFSSFRAQLKCPPQRDLSSLSKGPSLITL